MIGGDEIAQAFMDLMPHMGDPEGAIRERGVDPDAVAPIAQNLVHMYSANNTPPEDAVPASFTIGFLVGLTLAQRQTGENSVL